MPEATLADVLAARDARAQRQNELLRQYNKPLVCFTMNIAGPVKVDALTQAAFDAGCARLLAGLKSMGFAALWQEDRSTVAGHELMLCVDAEPAALKRLCTRLEDSDRLGRLFDMDVIAPDGGKLARASERCCLVCGAPGRGCASRRLHAVSEIQAVTRRIIREHCLQNDARDIARLAVQSLLDEVCVTPKPGLVDRQNCGSHRDMDIFTFNASAAALGPYFEACFLSGAQTAKAPAAEAFFALQTLGLEAERVMYAATGGVNTHKGAIYTLGVLCGAAGRVWAPAARPAAEAWLGACAALTRENAAAGVRAEVAAGLPSVRDIALPALREGEEKGLAFNDRCLLALLRLIARVRDTNMRARGGEEKAVAAQVRVQALLDAVDGLPDRAALIALDEDFIRERLSPGGCADLLAAALLIRRWAEM